MATQTTTITEETSTVSSIGHDQNSRIYVSSVTLKLKQGDNNDYAWHTEVLTPPNTPLTPAQETDVAPERMQSTATETKVGNNISKHQEPQQKHRTLPPIYDRKPKSLVPALTNFMAVERYHSSNWPAEGIQSSRI